MQKSKKKIIICDHPLIKHKLSILRDQETGTNEFRAIVEEIAMLIGYEALRDLELTEVAVETPIETAMCPVIAGKKQAIVPRQSQTRKHTSVKPPFVRLHQHITLKYTKYSSGSVPCIRSKWGLF